MKRIFQHPTGPETGRTYWRSLDQLENTPEFREALEREFPAGAQELETDGISRRAFLRLMGASVALAGVGLSSCRRPELHAVPYTASPEWIVPGKALQYATVMPRRFGAVPLLATSYEGRPTHLEGNSQVPGFSGGLDVLAQASILDLYDPDRVRSCKEKGQEVKAARFAELIPKIAEDYAAKQGQGLAILTEPSHSPTFHRLQKELQQKFPGMIFATHDPVGNENQAAALQVAFSSKFELWPLYDKADTILAIESDFCNGAEAGVSAVRGFASRRRVKNPGDKMNRLYVVESRFTATGGMADHRLRLAISWQGAFLGLIAQELVRQGKSTLQSVAEAAASTAEFSEEQKKWAREFAADFSKSANPLIVVGRQQPKAVHLLALAINKELGALGKTLPVAAVDAPESVDLSQLHEAIHNAQVETLITIGVNPVYTAPAALDWAETLKLVPQTIHVSHVEDETAALSQWTAPLAHYLESWGDVAAGHGMIFTQQPLVLPLYGGLSEIEILAALQGVPDALKPYVYPKPVDIAKPHVPGQSNVPLPVGFNLVKETFTQIHTNVFSEADWNKMLHDGYRVMVPGATGELYPDWQEAAVTAFLKANAIIPTAASDLEVTFYADSRLDDGRYANNGWLQELPDFTSKIAWDNAALLSPTTAKELDLKKSGEMIEIEIGGKTLKIVVAISPGHADRAISLALGHGRTHAGQVGSGVGVNVYPFWADASIPFISGVKVRKTGQIYKLAITQDHGTMEGRGLVREATLAEYEKDPGFAKKMHMDGHVPENVNIYKHPYTDPAQKGPEYLAPISADKKHQWGMVIDLTTCVGCNACTIACQSENNIPIVGKEQVLNKRSMQWIRVDRYYSDSPEDPQIAAQPVLCQHCENAPCEAVCPVNATVHTEEGLNIMAYNRCIGTRYCANNCPYKVRRFNYFDYNARDVVSTLKIGPIELGNLYLGPLGKEGSPVSTQMQRNPNVTVRVRGVMEKCSFCVQRIEEAKIDALNHAKGSASKPVPTDSFKTACQISCPAEAIVFGNISDPESAVSKLRGTDREYALLGYLNTRPRVTYLARLRNPNPRMPGAEKIGWGSDWDKVGPYHEMNEHVEHAGAEQH